MANLDQCRIPDVWFVLLTFSLTVTFYLTKKIETELKSRLILFLLMVEKGITSGLYHYVNRYAKANNKYVKDHDKNEEP